jgi:hypothetical protein
MTAGVCPWLRRGIVDDIGGMDELSYAPDPIGRINRYAPLAVPG